MTSSFLKEPVILGSAGLLAGLLGGLAIYLALKKAPTPEELERQRRAYLVSVGRIIDGTVLDIADVELGPAAASGTPQPAARKRHVFYQYEIAGVTYECSQDVSLFEQQLLAGTATPGMPTSVRYDPHNPSNSIVVAELWTGLHWNNTFAGLRKESAGVETEKR